MNKSQFSRKKSPNFPVSSSIFFFMTLLVCKLALIHGKQGETKEKSKPLQVAGLTSKGMYI